MIDDPTVGSVVKAGMTEVRAVGERLGAEFDATADERLALSRRLGSFRTPMLQDFERGRELAVDPLLKAVSTLGKLSFRRRTTIATT